MSRNTLSLFLVILIAVVSYQCNSSGSNQSQKGAIVYGNVANFDSTEFPNVGILITYYSGDCGPGGQQALGSTIRKSGSYRFLLPSLGAQCYEGSLIRIPQTQAQASDITVIDGPKEFVPPFRDDSPYDSVQVNFDFPSDTTDTTSQKVIQNQSDLNTLLERGALN